MGKKRWLVPLAAFGLGAGVAYLYVHVRRGGLQDPTSREQGAPMPQAGLYSALAGALMGGLYRRLASEIAANCPTGQALEIGSGPGHLAVRLSETVPRLRIVGIDISPEMVERAQRRTEAAAVSERVRFEVGSVTALPFADGQFDIVFSTFSLHHWADPAAGLVEIHRVLKPGGKALIYDLPGWVMEAVHHGAVDRRTLLAASPFEKKTVANVPWPGPLPLTRRMTLQRENATSGYAAG